MKEYVIGFSFIIVGLLLVFITFKMLRDNADGRQLNTKITFIAYSILSIVIGLFTVIKKYLD